MEVFNTDGHTNMHHSSISFNQLSCSIHPFFPLFISRRFFLLRQILFSVTLFFNLPFSSSHVHPNSCLLSI